MAPRSRCSRPLTDAWSSSGRRRPRRSTAPAMSTELASLSWNPVSDWNQLTTYPFMVQALEAGTIVAVIAGAIGWFMVLRRQTFAGHTLAVVAFPGAAAASLAGLPLALGYYGFCGLGALALSAASREEMSGRSGESAAIGTVQAL